MHRCWLETQETLKIGENIALSRAESDHVEKVLRMKQGDAVQLIAADRLYDGVIMAVTDGNVMVKATTELPSPESSVRITLLQGLPKSDKLEWIVQKATELGVYAIQPVEMTRSVAKITQKDDKKTQRLNRIAMEAAKQAGRAHIPEVFPSLPFSKAVENLEGAVYVAWEEAKDGSIAELIRNDNPKDITLVIGPEGGITEEEIKKLRECGGKTVTLGKRILRTETAGMCALTLIMAALGEM